MPGRRVHKRISKIYLGTYNAVVHDILDKSLGFEHRSTHTPDRVKLIGELLGKEAEREAMLHILTDYGLFKEIG